MLGTVVRQRFLPQFLNRCSAAATRLVTSSSSVNDETEQKISSEQMGKGTAPSGKEYFKEVIQQLQTPPLCNVDQDQNKYQDYALSGMQQEELAEQTGRSAWGRGSHAVEANDRADSQHGFNYDNLNTNENNEINGKHSKFSKLKRQNLAPPKDVDMENAEICSDDLSVVKDSVREKYILPNKQTPANSENQHKSKKFSKKSRELEHSFENMAYCNFQEAENLHQLQHEELQLDDAFSIEKFDELRTGDVARRESQETYDHVAPILGPSFNLATFVPRSQTLQELVKLGVELHVWERKADVAEAILMLDFEQDIKPCIKFLSDKKVPPDALGRMFTMNPNLLKEDLENIQIRLNYLESKKFTPSMMVEIMVRLPQFLSLRTVEVDKKLGLYQKIFHLTGDEIRDVVVRNPKLFILEKGKFDHSQFLMSETFGFTEGERKQLFLTYPKIWFIGAKSLESRFNVVHNLMRLDHDTMIRFPQCFLTRHWKIKERHLYLEKIGRTQYNPTKERYVSLKDVCLGTDSEFCENVAKTSVDQFNEFLKTL